MKRFQTLSKGIMRSVLLSAAAALALSSAGAIAIVQTKNQSLLHTVAELRMIKASAVINPVLLDRVIAAKVKGVDRDRHYLELLDQLKSSVRIMPGASAQLLLVKNNKCWNIMSVLPSGVFQESSKFKNIIPCPWGATESLSFHHATVADGQKFLRLPSGLATYRLVSNGKSGAGVLSIRFDFSQARENQDESFMLILLLQLPIFFTVAIVLKRSLARHMERLTVLVLGVQDLGSGNYDQVEALPEIEGQFDELDILTHEVKESAAKLKSDSENV